DAEILADVYLTMTGGQTNLSLAGDGADSESGGRQQATPIRRLPADRASTLVIRANAEEVAAHEVRMRAIEKAAGTAPLWLQLEQAASDEPEALPA
ncbi:MAG TPA: DNA polymerase III subunit epsilon, partial [Pseudomonas sp.]|nr:DNA polymerase III subunit epsilon [Pseudomonas sp.]